MAKVAPEFATETDLVAAFVECVDRRNATSGKNGRRRNGQDPSTWTIYHESCGYDLLLVEDQTGVQLGLEAKLLLNLKVINQVLPSRYSRNGPDYRAVLVPDRAVQPGLGEICNQIGIGILGVYNSRMGYGNHKPKPEWNINQGLPDEREAFDFSMRDWHPWLPEMRCVLPEYVPDVVGGKPAPVALTEWKIRAIKLLVLLERRGHVTRKDMRILKISPTRWTAGSYGYLLADKALGGYVACSNTPDLRSQHPVNYAQIEADYEKWSVDLDKAE
jgi:hypothetical protein